MSSNAGGKDDQHGLSVDTDKLTEHSHTVQDLANELISIAENGRDALTGADTPYGIVAQLFGMGVCEEVERQSKSIAEVGGFLQSISDHLKKTEDAYTSVDEWAANQLRQSGVE